MDDEALRELFAALGPVSIRKMFGGRGIHHDGLIVGLALSTGEVLLKGDVGTASALEAAGAVRWAYDGKGRRVNMPYWSIPDSAMDDPEELAGWTRKALEAALRAQDKARSAPGGGTAARRKRRLGV